MIWGKLDGIVSNVIVSIFVGRAAAGPSSGGGVTANCGDFVVGETLPAAFSVLSRASLTGGEVLETSCLEPAAAVTWWVDGIAAR